MLNEISKGKIGKFSLLRHKKQREEFGLFMVQGHKGVADTLKTFDPVAVIVRKDTDVEFELRNGLPIFLATDTDIKKITTLETLPDVIAVYKIPKNSDANEILNKNHYYLLLDGIQDPGNLGTIIRTAHWFGIEKIFCSRETVDCYNPKVVQSSMGSLGKVKIIYTDLEELIEKNPEMPVFGLQLKGENIFDAKDIKAGIIIMGNEGNGLSESIKKRVTRSLTIPPKHPFDHPESLNVSTATAITLACLTQK